MTHLEWIKTLSAEELADWFYDEWLGRMQYQWSSSRGGLVYWLNSSQFDAYDSARLSCNCIGMCKNPYKQKEK